MPVVDELLTKFTATSQEVVDESKRAQQAVASYTASVKQETTTSIDDLKRQSKQFKDIFEIGSIVGRYVAAIGVAIGSANKFAQAMGNLVNWATGFTEEMGKASDSLVQMKASLDEFDNTQMMKRMSAGAQEYTKTLDGIDKKLQELRDTKIDPVRLDLISERDALIRRLSLQRDEFERAHARENYDKMEKERTERWKQAEAERRQAESELAADRLNDEISVRSEADRIELEAAKKKADAIKKYAGVASGPLGQEAARELNERLRIIDVVAEYQLKKLQEAQDEKDRLADESHERELERIAEQERREIQKVKSIEQEFKRMRDAQAGGLGVSDLTLGRGAETQLTSLLVRAGR